MLEWASAIVQVGVGIIFLWAAGVLRRISWYFLPLVVAGVCLVITGAAGILNVGDLDSIIQYRRPLFIIERTAMGFIVIGVVARNKMHAATRANGG